MKNVLLTAVALMGVAASAHALTQNGSAWSCSQNANQGSSVGLQYCTATNYTSGTTSTQLGKFTLNSPSTRQVTFVGGVSGSALSGLVTPTVSFYLGNRVIATQSVSVTSAGNVVTFGVNGVPYFDGLSISTSLPGTISATNSLSIGVIENTRVQSVQ